MNAKNIENDTARYAMVKLVSNRPRGGGKGGDGGVSGEVGDMREGVGVHGVHRRLGAWASGQADEQQADGGAGEHQG